MIRKIIKIDREKCDCCGLCVTACHEGAIGIVDGKAELLRDDYCDGLGDCLPACPKDAISFEEREALAFDKAAVTERMRAKAAEETSTMACGCPGSNVKSLKRENHPSAEDMPCGCSGSNPMSMERKGAPSGGAPSEAGNSPASELSQWPVQIRLVPVTADYFNDADLLIAADCSAFAHGAFHRVFMKGRVTLIGCPKLDDVKYSEKLAAIIEKNRVRSVTVVRMEVPCCGGLEHAVVEALKQSGKDIPCRIVTLSLDGEIISI